MPGNNLRTLQEDTRFSTKNVEHHTIPELTNDTPIPDAAVNSGPDAEAWGHFLFITLMMLIFLS